MILFLDYPVQSSPGPEGAVTFISLNRTGNGSGGGQVMCSEPPAVLLATWNPAPRGRSWVPGSSSCTEGESGARGVTFPSHFSVLSIQPSVCFAYYLETDDSDSDSQSGPMPRNPARAASPSKPRRGPRGGAGVGGIPLCCLSILCLSSLEPGAPHPRSRHPQPPPPAPEPLALPRGACWTSVM